MNGQLPCREQFHIVFLGGRHCSRHKFVDVVYPKHLAFAANLVTSGAPQSLAWQQDASSRELWAHHVSHGNREVARARANIKGTSPRCEVTAKVF